MTFLSTKKETGTPASSNTGNQSTAPQQGKSVAADENDDLPF